MSWVDLIGIALAGLTAWVLLRPVIRDADVWRATVTPLASIIGSGFLVVAPLLALTVGSAAIPAMVGIVALSFWIGGAIRYNIRHVGRAEAPQAAGGIARLETLSDIALAIAYVISIAFYIRLLASFVLRLPGIDSDEIADALATSVLLFIGLYGSRYGLRGLERLEEYSVTIKLAIIGALLFWLAQYNALNGYSYDTLRAPEFSLWEQVRILAGMLLVVQGFETSKYLDTVYSRDMRQQTMLRAQVVAGVIYVVFIALVMPVVSHETAIVNSESALIGIVSIVTPILPVLLVVAAVMSQFSAAVADTLGAGGLIARESRGALTTHSVYLIIVAGAILLIWITDIFELVAIASRAFAMFYLLQAMISFKIALANEHGTRRVLRSLGYLLLILAMLFVVVFGKAAEA